MKKIRICIICFLCLISLNVNAAMLGDINDSGAIDLGDAVLALQALTGHDLPAPIMAADINGDNRIGLEEVLYILQTLVGSRELDTIAPVTTASPGGNTFIQGLALHLSTNEPAVIYFTTDGSQPDINSPVYDEAKPLQITGNTILKFFALDLSGNAEKVKTETYIIDPAPATISGLPEGLSNAASYRLTIGGTGVMAYRYRVDGDSWSAETAVDTAISLTDLLPGVHTLYVIAKDANGQWQAEDNASTVVWQQEKTDALISTTGNVNGMIQGLSPGDRATVILGSDSYLKSAFSQDDGAFFFAGIPDGRYFLKIDINGYATGAARDVIVARKFGLMRSPTALDAPAEFVATRIDSSLFSYHWEQDASRSGYQQSAYINRKQQVIFRNETLEVVDLAAAEKLEHDYHIVLSDEGALWNQEYAYRLLETLKSIPQVLRNSSQVQTLSPSKWLLTNDYLADDIAMERSEMGNVITLSTAAFVYASPRLVLLDGLKGTFFSQRLHHALVRYVTDDGKNHQAVEKILQDRYGCTTIIPDYSALTLPTTKEDGNSFQSFHPQELVELINMFEEMPKGYHVVKGLKYLARRKDGMPHPLYNEAPAVSWPTAHAESYIEFLDTTFTSDFDHMHRLILHEKSHFLWTNLFSQALKDDWITLGGWYENPADPDGWSTTKTTEFVTAYAHKKNPDEDMAESISYFVLNPDMLRSRSLLKYEFVRDRVMNGNLYIAKIREDLTFEVLNLFPDYNYPGKIKRVDISVAGLPEEDKAVTVEIELHILDKVFDGAGSAYARVLSEIGTYEDFYMFPVNDNGSILRGSFVISKYSKSGFWFTDQIVVTDQVGNQRFEGMDDFGWKLFINSPLEDTVKPRYVPHSLALQLSDPELVNGHEVQRLTVTWQVDENKEMRSPWPVYTHVTNPESGAYRQEDYGTYDEATRIARVVFNITEYFAPGHYGVPYIGMYDQAENFGDQRFSDSPNHETLSSVYINPVNPDVTPPEVDLNRITVSATSVNPTAPDGETLVKIVYYARDDKSGVGIVSYRLLDPQGLSHYQWHYHENFYTLFFAGDPTVWNRYEISVVLPQGSAPGIWGLQQMEVYDKAQNRESYNFVETLHFEIQSQP